MAQDKSHLTVYKPQQFVKERQLNIRYGNKPSRKELKQFNRYWNSEQRQIDEHTQYMYELNKMFDSVQRNMDYLRTKYRPKPLTPIQSTPRTPSTPSDPSTPNAPTAPSTPSTPSTTTTTGVISIPYWEEVAKQNGFNSMQEVAEWQAKHGLVADGKFGNRSRAKKAALESGNTSGSGSTDETVETGATPGQSSTPANSTELSVTNPESGFALSSPAYTIDQLWNSHLFKSYAGENHLGMTTGTDRTRILINGKEYPVVITQGFARNESGILPYTYYAYDPATGLVKRLETSWGTPYSTHKHPSKNSSFPIEGGQFAPGAKWRNPQKLFDIYPTQEAAKASL